jgi:hypothetical protein
MRIRLKCLLCVLASCNFAYGQSFRSELKKAIDFLSTSKVKYSVEYEFVDQAKPQSAPLQTQTVLCYLWPPYSVYKYPEVEMYHNDRFKLAVYKKQKALIVNKSTQQKQQALSISVAQLDTILKIYQKIEMLPASGGLHTYRLTFKKALKEYSHAEITLDPETTRLHSITLYFKKTLSQLQPGVAQYQDIKPLVRIRFSDYRLLAKGDWSQFMAGNILTVDNKGRVNVTAPYRNYQVSNFYRVK